MRFDHLVLVVSDLAQATSDFSGMGFTVTQGGVHAGGVTHNALIGLADGSYLELLAATRRRQQALYRWTRRLGVLRLAIFRQNPIQQRFSEHLASGEGLSDFALLVEDLDLELEKTRRRGFDLTGPLPGSRLLPDGQRIAWRFGVPGSTDLPFLIEDVTPRPLRLPSGAAQEHPNGVTGSAALTIACFDLDQTIKLFQRLAGFEPEEGLQDLGQSPRRASFNLGETALTFFEAGHDQAMRKWLSGRPARPHSLYLRANPPSPALCLSFLSGRGFHLERAALLKDQSFLS